MLSIGRFSAGAAFPFTFETSASYSLQTRARRAMSPSRACFHAIRCFKFAPLRHSRRAPRILGALQAARINVAYPSAVAEALHVEEADVAFPIRAFGLLLAGHARQSFATRTFVRREK